MHRTCRTKTRAEIIHADHKKSVCVHGFARTDHIVPPTCIAFFILTRNVVRSVERVANQHRIAFVRVEHTVGFIHQMVVANLRATLQRQRFSKREGLCDGFKGGAHNGIP